MRASHAVTLTFATGCLLGATLAPALARAFTMEIIVHGSICVSDPSGAAVGQRSEGAYNTSGASTAFFLCPIQGIYVDATHDTFGSDATDILVQVDDNSTNATTGAVSVQACSVANSGGGVTCASAATTSTTGTGTSTLSPTNWSSNVPSDYYFIAGSLPPGTTNRVRGITVQF